MHSIDRRRFLASIGLGAGALVLPGCATRPRPASTGCLAPVRVSTDRVTRTVVGLRPYRDSGFVVREERLGATRLVHNYGHGGCGITLSWGTSRLAVDMGLQGHSGPVAVIGAGAVGLATARLVQEAGFPVTLYAAALPPTTTSDIAAGKIMPSGHYRPDAVTPEWRARFAAAAEYSLRRFESLLAGDFGVRRLPTYGEHGGGPPDPDVAAFMANARLLGPEEHPFAASRIRRYDGLYVDTGRYLSRLLGEIAAGGGAVLRRSFASPAEIVGLPQGLVFNCTGLGARELFGDGALRPARGVLVELAAQPEIGHAYTMAAGYMFTRPDRIILGGSFDLDDWSMEPDPATVAAILARHGRIAAGWRCAA
jgi:glycine/D-amino acid oxidase-like deaminating enzyme